jgi:hypothetical protein
MNNGTVKPYFIVLNHSSIAAGVTQDLPSAVRNSTGRPFIWTALSVWVTDTDDISFSIKTTTEDSFFNDRLRANSIGASNTGSVSKLELATPYRIGSGIELTSTVESHEASGTTSAVQIQLHGYLE